MVPSTVRNKFYSILFGIEERIAAFVNKPGADMTRHRHCDFTSTVIATLSFSMNRTNTELINFFGIKRKHIPSKSAFTQQRKKFNDKLYPQLLKEFNKATPFAKTFKGFHLVAVDGSDINLPTDKNDTIYRVKQARSDNYYYQMHLNALYDICENRYVSVVIQPRPNMNENAAFCQLVSDYDMPQNTIFMADRGYITFNTIAHLIKNNCYFLIRAKAPNCPGSFTKNLMEADTFVDKTVLLGLTRSSKNLHNPDFDVIKKLSVTRKFDYLPSNDKDSIYGLKIRCTCIQLPDGSYEYLISNLSKKIFSADDLKELYWKRWSIETSFRSLKYALSLVYLHSVNRELIIQEVYAKILMYNITSLLHSYAQNSEELLECNKKNKHKYKISFDDVVPIAKELLKKPISNSIIKALLLRHLTAIKKGIASPRYVRSQTVKPLNNRA